MEKTKISRKFLAGLLAAAMIISSIASAMPSYALEAGEGADSFPPEIEIHNEGDGDSRSPGESTPETSPGDDSSSTPSDSDGNNDGENADNIPGEGDNNTADEPGADEPVIEAPSADGDESEIMPVADIRAITKWWELRTNSGEVIGRIEPEHGVNVSNNAIAMPGVYKFENNLGSAEFLAEINQIISTFTDYAVYIRLDGWTGTAEVHDAVRYEITGYEYNSARTMRENNNDTGNPPVIVYLNLNINPADTFKWDSGSWPTGGESVNLIISLLSADAPEEITNLTQWQLMKKGSSVNGASNINSSHYDFGAMRGPLSILREDLNDDEAIERFIQKFLSRYDRIVFNPSEGENVFREENIREIRGMEFVSSDGNGATFRLIMKDRYYKLSNGRNVPCQFELTFAFYKDESIADVDRWGIVLAEPEDNGPERYETAINNTKYLDFPNAVNEKIYTENADLLKDRLEEMFSALDVHRANTPAAWEEYDILSIDYDAAKTNSYNEAAESSPKDTRRAQIFKITIAPNLRWQNPNTVANNDQDGESNQFATYYVRVLEPLITEFPPEDSEVWDYLTVKPNEPASLKMNLFDYWTNDANPADEHINPWVYVDAYFDIRESYNIRYWVQGINYGNHALRFFHTGEMEAFKNEDLIYNVGVWNYSTVNKTSNVTGIVRPLLADGYPQLNLVGDSIYGPDNPYYMTQGYHDVRYPVDQGKNLLGEWDGTGNESLRYLFDPYFEGQGGRAAYRNVTGLIQMNERGYYYYDSKLNFAEFVADSENEAANKEDSDGYFRLYNTWGVEPNERGGSPDGQFFPFNKYDQVFEGYLERRDENGNLVSTTLEHRTREDGLDSRSEIINHHLGLTLEVEFQQPSDGVLNHGTDDPEVITFKFAGDDDVWVFIDDVLVLDLGGVHSGAYGEINFTTGEVKTGLMASDEDYGVRMDERCTWVKTTTLADLYKYAGVYDNFAWQEDEYGSRAGDAMTVIDSDGRTTTITKGNNPTFASNTVHTMKFFYMERGHWDSNLAIYWNMQENISQMLYKIDEDGNPLGVGTQFDMYPATPNSPDVLSKPYPLSSEFTASPNRIAHLVVQDNVEEDLRGYVEITPYNGDDKIDFATLAVRDGIRYFILEEIESGQGYKKLLKKVLLSYNPTTDTFKILNQYEIGGYASFTASIVDNNDQLYYASSEYRYDEDGHLHFTLKKAPYNYELKGNPDDPRYDPRLDYEDENERIVEHHQKDALLFAVPMIYIDKGDGPNWYAVWGSNTYGYNIVDLFKPEEYLGSPAQTGDGTVGGAHKELDSLSPEEWSRIIKAATGDESHPHYDAVQDAYRWALRLNLLAAVMRQVADGENRQDWFFQYEEVSVTNVNGEGKDVSSARFSARLNNLPGDAERYILNNDADGDLRLMGLLVDSNAIASLLTYKDDRLSWEDAIDEVEELDDDGKYKLLESFLTSGYFGTTNQKTFAQAWDEAVARETYDWTEFKDILQAAYGLSDTKTSRDRAVNLAFIDAFTRNYSSVLYIPNESRDLLLMKQTPGSDPIPGAVLGVFNTFEDAVLYQIGDSTHKPVSIGATDEKGRLDFSVNGGRWAEGAPPEEDAKKFDYMELDGLSIPVGDSKYEWSLHDENDDDSDLDDDILWVKELAPPEGYEANESIVQLYVGELTIYVNASGFEAVPVMDGDEQKVIDGRPVYKTTAGTEVTDITDSDIENDIRLEKKLIDEIPRLEDGGDSYDYYKAILESDNSLNTDGIMVMASVGKLFKSMEKFADDLLNATLLDIKASDYLYVATGDDGWEPYKNPEAKGDNADGVDNTRYWHDLTKITTGRGDEMTALRPVMNLHFLGDALGFTSSDYTEHGATSNKDESATFHYTNNGFLWLKPVQATSAEFNANHDDDDTILNAKRDSLYFDSGETDPVDISNMFAPVNVLLMIDDVKEGKGRLTISKEVENGTEEDNNLSFEFTITLLDEENNPQSPEKINDTFYAYRYLTEPVHMTFVDGVATEPVILPEGRVEVRLFGLAVDYRYVVKDAEDGQGKIVTIQRLVELQVPDQDNNTTEWQDAVDVKRWDIYIILEKDIPVEFTDGEARVNLKHGESLTIEGLNAGYHYTVKESDSQGMEFSPQEGYKGTIETEKEHKADFKNYPEEIDPPTPGFGRLKVSKTLDTTVLGTLRPQTSPAFTFNIEIYDLPADAPANWDKNVTFTRTTRGGTVETQTATLQLVDGKWQVLDKDGKVITLSYGDSIAIDNIPLGAKYTVKEGTTGGYVLTEKNGDTGEITASAEASFVNMPVGDLDITKVVNRLPNATDEFEFEVTLTRNDAEKTPFNSGPYALVWQKQVDGVFVNMTKEEVARAGKPTRIYFKEGKAYFEDGNREGILKVKAGEKVHIENLPAGAQFTVTENTIADYDFVRYEKSGGRTTGVTGTVRENGISGTVRTNSHVLITATNQPVGNIKVKKRVNNPGGATLSEAEFEFTVKLYRRSDNTALSDAATGEYDLIIYDKDGNPSEPVKIRFNNGNTYESIKLKDGESAEIIGLPAGLYYEITEKALSGFSVKNDSGENSGATSVKKQIQKNEDGEITTPQVTFNNTPVGDIRLTKTVGNSASSNARDYHFRITLYTDPSCTRDKIAVDIQGNHGREHKDPADTTAISFKDGVADFYVRSGTDLYSLLSNLPSGLYYVIEELDNTGYFLTWTTGEGQTVKDGKLYGQIPAPNRAGAKVTASVAATNTPVGDVAVEKQIAADFDSRRYADIDFHISIRINNTDNSYVRGKSYPITIADKPYTLTFDESGNGTITPGTAGEGEESPSASDIIIKAGNTINIKGLPVGTVVTVTETGPGGFRASYTTTNSQNTTSPGQSRTLGGKVTVVNTPLGDVDVEKQIDTTYGRTATGNFVMDITAEFPANTTDRSYEVVKVVDGDEGGLTEEHYGYITLGSTTTRNTITVPAGTRLRIKDLPLGTRITFRETDTSSQGYKVTYSPSATATAAARGSAVQMVTVTNTPLGNLSVSKTVSGVKVGGEMTDFPFTVTFYDGNPNATDPDIPGTKLTGDITAKVTKTGQESKQEPISDGSYQFTLKHGETLTIEDLPAGIWYTVTETNSGQYDVSGVPSTGQIARAGTVTVGAENRRSTGKVSLTKTVIDPYGGAGEDSFTFTVTLYSVYEPEGENNQLFTDITSAIIKKNNDEEGETLTFTEGVSGTITLTDRDTITIEGLPTGVIAVFREGNHPGYLLTWKDGKFYATVTADGETAEAENTPVGDMQITKTVSGDHLLTTDPEEFTFTITFYNGDPDATDPDIPGTKLTGDITAKVTKTGQESKQEPISDGSYEFKLEHGQTLTITDLPAGVWYTVTETDPGVFDANITPAKGQITKGSKAEISATNTRKTGGFKLTKTVSAANVTEGEGPGFEFTVTLDPAISGTFGGITFDADGIGKVTLKHGQDVTVSGLPTGVTYTISEGDYTNYDLSWTKDGNTATGTIGGTIGDGDADHRFVATNTRKTGGIEVMKTVSAEDINEDQEFTFTVTFTDIGDDFPATLSGTRYTVGNKDDTSDNNVPLDVTKGRDNTATITFTLKHYQKIEITGIPTGVSYTVAEGTVPGYTNTGKTGDSGTVSADTTITTAFTNTRETGDLVIAKTVTGNGAESGKLFWFKVTLNDENINGTYSRIKFTNGVSGVFSVAAGSSLTIEGLPTGVTYTVEEVNRDGTPFADDYYTNTGLQGNGGTITADAENKATVTATNTRKTGGITIAKTVQDKENDTTPFTFRVKLYTAYTDPEEPRGSNRAFTFTDKVNNRITANKNNPREEITLTFNDSGVSSEFTLTAGQSITIPDLPTGVIAVVEEVVATGYKLTWDDDKYYGTVGDDLSFTANNRFKTGGLSLKKEVTGNGAEQDKEFTFRITLNPAISGTFGGYQFNEKGVSENIIIKASDEPVIIDGLPENTEFTVEEISVAEGYSLVRINPANGTIKDNEIINVVATNRRVSGGLIVSKEVAGTGADDEKDFTFTVTLYEKYDPDFPDDEEKTVKYTGGVTATFTYDGSPAKDPDEESKTFSGSQATFTLRHGQNVYITGLPTGVIALVTEDSGSEYTLTWNGDKNYGPVDSNTALSFAATNTYKTGGFTLSKEVDGNGADEDKGFEFTVTLDPAVSGTYGGITFDEHGQGKITLKHGQDVTVSDLPAGTEYTITEATGSDYTLTWNQGATTNGANAVTGTIEENDNLSFTATNTRNVTDDSAGLTVTKVVEGARNDFDGKFTFTVTLYDGDPTNGGKPLTGDAYTFEADIKVNGTSDKLQFTKGVSDGFELGGGESAVITGLPTGVYAVVSEADHTGFDLVWTEGNSTEDDEAFGLTGTRLSFTATNTFRTGNITINKTVSGVGADSNKQFTFIVRLSDETINGEYGGMNFEKGVARVKVTPGTPVTATGLPEGITYTITEEPEQGYSLEWTSAVGEDAEINETSVKGKVHNDRTASFTARNTRTSGNLQVEKTVIAEDIDTNRVFEFTVTFADTDDNFPGSLSAYVYSGAEDETDEPPETLTVTAGDTRGTKKVTFSLKHGQRIVINGIPSGTVYTVTEKENGDYVTTQTGDSGTIAESATPKAGFTNTRVTGDLSIKKTVTGRDGDTNKLFTFKITLDDPNINGTYGGLKFTGGESETFTLKHDQIKEITGLPRGVGFTITETDNAGYTLEWSGDISADGKGTIRAQRQGTVSVTATNERDTGNLKISKTVTGTGADPEKLFEFEIRLSDTTINGEYSGVNFESGVATVYLKDGEDITITGLPLPVTYTVTEKNYDGYTPDRTEKSGSLSKGNTAEVGFTNTLKTGKVSVTKILESKNTDVSFNFKVTLYTKYTPEADDNKVAEYIDGVTIGGVLFTKGVGQFDLVHNRTKEIDGLPDGIIAVIEETDHDGYDLTWKDGKYYGTVGDTDLSFTANNRRETGKLTVIKAVSATNVDSNKTFTFTVTFTDIGDDFPATLSGTRYTVGTPVEGGVSAALDVTRGEGNTATVTFTLTDRQGMYITGIPTGVGYTVREAEDNDYTTTSQNTNGEIELGTVNTASFTNTLKEGNLSIEKEVDGNGADEDMEFEFTITLDPYLEGEYTYGDVEFNDGEGKIKLKHGQSADITGLPVGTEYTITEATGSDYTLTWNEGATTNGANAVTGTIKENDNLSFTATNTRNTTNLTLTKVVENKDDDDTGFNFEITLYSVYNDPDGAPDKLFTLAGQTITAKVTGGESDRNIGLEFDRDGKASFTLYNGESIYIDNLPTGVTFTIEEKDHSGYELSWSSGDDDEDGIAVGVAGTDLTFTATNTYVTGDIEIEKEVDDNQANPDAEFTLKITLYTEYDPDKTSNPVAAINGSFGTDRLGEEIEFVNGVAEITVKHGKVDITGLPENLYFTVVETERGGYTPQIKVDGESVNYGRVKGNDTVEVYVLNEHQPIGGITLSKTVDGRWGDEDREFEFTITLSNKTIEGRYGDVTFKEGVGKIKLKHGRSADITGLPVGTEFTITEDSGEYRIEWKGEVNANGYAIVVDGQMLDAQAVNTRQTGDLIITKTVTGNSGDTEKKFRFVITLDETISDIFNLEWQNKDEDDPLTIEFTDGIAEVYLKHGQTVTIKDLPAGVKYTVTEPDPDGHKMTRRGDEGRIPAGGNITARFENSKGTQPTPTPPDPGNPPPPPPDIPDTSDGSNLPLWFAMLISSITGLFATAFFYRRRELVPVAVENKKVYTRPKGYKPKN